MCRAYNLLFNNTGGQQTSFFRIVVQFLSVQKKKKSKGKAIPVTGREGP
jgi:hypothetical protein